MKNITASRAFWSLDLEGGFPRRPWRWKVSPLCQGTTINLDRMAAGTSTWKWWLLRGRSGGWNKIFKKAKWDGKMVKGTEALTKRWAAVSLCVTRDFGPQGSSFEGTVHSVRAVANGSFTVARVYPLPSVFCTSYSGRHHKSKWLGASCPILQPGCAVCVAGSAEQTARRQAEGRSRGFPKRMEPYCLLSISSTALKVTVNWEQEPYWVKIVRHNIWPFLPFSVFVSDLVLDSKLWTSESCCRCGASISSEQLITRVFPISLPEKILFQVSDLWWPRKFFPLKNSFCA